MNEVSYLAHHGIKGQKWGIRRYQNYDGSYTQAGLKRYYKSKEDYEHASDRYNQAKISYKNDKTSENKIKLTNARLNNVKAKRHMQNVYKHLKKDKLADQGKELYSKGYTIRGKRKATKYIKMLGTAALASTFIAAQQDGKIPVSLPHIPVGINVKMPAKLQYEINKHNKEIAIAGVVAIGASVTADIITANKDKKLRAYYNHSSNYRRY